ncbi:nitrilase-related carbon-nitrogen hydrolase [Alicyclobacillus ferrooxydans]|uniref:CN hydrolase domain-containing protein n=1 Tax=Alicyclobacillus ferrooxydans TaxID=471514 RepID=A0A0P9D355_9BACL|nr:nitrilase-related carbon-nitrogen hydrolase [Alicyclobacillus ferrooxydans]KPV43943.1 hypothetical protein AN477_09470 [Alicyclobacillus ferrooxydans]
MRSKDSVKVAVIQAASEMMELEASVEKACRLITEAGKQGAELIVFPEAFLSGYPRGLSFGAVVGSRALAGRQDFGRYWRSAVTVPSPATDRLAKAIAEAHAYVVMGIPGRVP